MSPRKCIQEKHMSWVVEQWDRIHQSVWARLWESEGKGRHFSVHVLASVLFFLLSSLLPLYFFLSLISVIPSTSYFYSFLKSFVIISPSALLHPFFTPPFLPSFVLFNFASFIILLGSFFILLIISFPHFLRSMQEADHFRTTQPLLISSK